MYSENQEENLAGNSFQFSGIACFDIGEINIVINLLYQTVDSPSFFEGNDCIFSNAYDMKMTINSCGTGSALI